ncbi:protein-glutamine gamma-glutamyltransferase E-like [Hyla sarda]|uniref:protein-glutamine gamma-glutamyltransferase E-like n=1 Tax=Hyla sarda TaxID=327740 RepID=UPI0024C2D2CF|nr:protein-glutamine gamma-glutamyltransferase E-like [Hyla sarda]
MEKESNMKAHRTDNYKSSNLILRRGQEFRIQLHFNRPLQKGDKVEFIAGTGPAPEESQDTLAVFQLSGSKKGKTWMASIDSGSSAEVKVTIKTPSGAPIGPYKMSLYISSKRKKSYFRLDDVILLFNPWAKDDVVYMEKEDERLEYVLNDNGIIYFGLVDYYIDESGWNYGQFEEGILDICFQVLNRSLNYQEDGVVDCAKRYDPGYVGRVVSAMINSFEDEGVLEGKWSSKFTGGVNPEDWNGSVDILRMWRKRGYRPVKYGQCWVFAGVMCTVLRCLGIPTRVVTNFVSAHDKDGNLSIDTLYSKRGKAMSKDSLWNFHVWNESWFSRRDLGPRYGGWQVLDSTPQELSGGVHCCGPASVHAIKEGDVDLDLDGPFIFSEVNADCITWIYYDKDLKEKVYTDREKVGKNISTKAVGSDTRIDITETYKYPEESEKERLIYLKACKKLKEMGIINKDDAKKRGVGKRRRKKRSAGSASDDLDDEKEEFDIQGRFEVNSSSKLGDDIKLTLHLKNTTKKSQPLKIKLSSTTIEYTGRPYSEVYSDTADLTVPPKKEKTLSLSIPSSDYEYELTSHHLMEVVALCELKNGKKMLIRKVVFIERPHLEIQIYGSAIVNLPLEVEVIYANPLSKVLKDAMLVFGGSGLVERTLRKKVPMLEPKESGRMFVSLTPSQAGSRQLTVDFTSKQFTTIKGFHKIQVKEAAEKHEEGEGHEEDEEEDGEGEASEDGEMHEDGETCDEEECEEEEVYEDELE